MDEVLRDVSGRGWGMVRDGVVRAKECYLLGKCGVVRSSVRWCESRELGVVWSGGRDE